MLSEKQGEGGQQARPFSEVVSRSGTAGVSSCNRTGGSVTVPSLSEMGEWVQEMGEASGTLE